MMMKAIGYQAPQTADHPAALVDIELPKPKPSERDLLVRIEAVSVNPVDTKVRASARPAAGEWKILGWDAVGTVEATGTAVSLFKPGDRVWYAGDISRAGSNAEYQLVDERIVGRAPARFAAADAAALPLTAITAWEMLFERLAINRDHTALPRRLLVVGAAGGVGSILVQLARTLTDLTIIGTASRPASCAWLETLGVHHVIDHHRSFSEQLAALKIESVGYAISLNQSTQHLHNIVDVLEPQGKFGLIDDPEGLDILPLKRKSLSLHWELMFTRALYHTHDMVHQHDLLNRVARMVETGAIKTTRTQHFGRITAANLLRAHQFLESGHSHGKVVLEGF